MGIVPCAACPHCNNGGPTISELESQYDAPRVVMVGIDARDDPAKVREFVDRYDIAGPAIYQPSLGSTYQVSGYLMTYLLNGENEWWPSTRARPQRKRKRMSPGSRRPSGPTTNVIQERVHKN